MKPSWRIKSALKRVIKRLGYDVRCITNVPKQMLEEVNVRYVEFDDVVCRRIVEVGRELTFIQVGAFDGVTADPLRKYIIECGWKGALVEPQADASKRLRELYDGNDRVKVFQAAVDRQAGSRTLYTVRSDGAPAWAGGLASFDRDTITRHSGALADVNARIQEESVLCLSLIHISEPTRPY